MIQDGNILPGYDFESIILEADSDDYQYRSNDSKSIIWPEKKFHLPENLKELLRKQEKKPILTWLYSYPVLHLVLILQFQRKNERVKKYFLDDLNVAEKDFISVRLATEDDKRPGIPVHHIPEYPYVLHIEYSWGRSGKPDQKFSTKEDAWKKCNVHGNDRSRYRF